MIYHVKVKTNHKAFPLADKNMIAWTDFIVKITEICLKFSITEPDAPLLLNSFSGNVLFL